LNFLVSETPYSAQIVLRKRFVKEATGPSWPQQSLIFPTSHENLNQVEQVQEENNYLQSRIHELEGNLKSSNETIGILEEKVSKAEASALKSFNEKSEEVAFLKTTIKNHHIELNTMKQDLKQERKANKEKDKLGLSCAKLSSSWAS
jgi:predicted RNase H-like nuclease (RuvC/YqgF family)